MSRMEQQVQRAVEAAKLKPKNQQLVIEGSLGKISFSNAKTPKPLLNIKRAESSQDTNRPYSAGRQPSERKALRDGTSLRDKKVVLRQIENVYMTLMLLEDHERHVPPRPTTAGDSEAVQRHMEWTSRMHDLNQKLWAELKVMEPIIPKYGKTGPQLHHAANSETVLPFFIPSSRFFLTPKAKRPFLGSSATSTKSNVSPSSP